MTFSRNLMRKMNEITHTIREKQLKWNTDNN
jgi:hypothetical protein